MKKYFVFLSILLNEYRQYHYIKKSRLLRPGSIGMIVHFWHRYWSNLLTISTVTQWT